MCADNLIYRACDGGAGNFLLGSNDKYSMKGFTLLELMITIAVLAIVSTVAIPSFQNQIRNNQVTSANNALITLMAQARSTAVRSNQEVTVRVTSTSAGWQIIMNPDSEDACGNESTCAQGSRVTMSPSPVVVTFDNRGYRVPFETSTVAVRHRACSSLSHARSVVITGTGQVVSERTSCE